MGLGVLNAAMLVGLCGMAIPLIVHFLNRRRDEVVDWAAMRFLDLGRRARQRLRLTEILLMLARMALLAAVALAAARPFWGGAGTSGAGGIGGAGGAARDLVIVIDGSSGMNRRLGDESTAKSRAVAAAKELASRLSPGDSAAVLVASDRVRALVDPPTHDHAMVQERLQAWEAEPGPKSPASGDLALGLAESFRLLERTRNPARAVVVLTDGRRAPWRVEESGRWDLLRELARRLPVPPRIWALALADGQTPESPNVSMGPIQLSRAVVTPGLPLAVSAEATNQGPGEALALAELWVDGRRAPGAARELGPISEQKSMSARFETTISSAGSHVVTIRLVGDDSLADDDESSSAVTVAPALPVLIVDGEPGREPLSGEADFLRAALSPKGDDAPQVAAEVVALDQFRPASLDGPLVLMLANVERLSLDQAGAIARFLESGGGVLVALGDRADPTYYNTLGWLPARIGARTGDFLRKSPVTRPAPASFGGRVFTSFAKGDAPPLGDVDIFAYFRLEPASGSVVTARFDTGEPWAVERTQGQGRVLLLAGPLDAEGGTLPVNPDFVPLVHEWALDLAGGKEPRPTAPGEPLIFGLNPPPPPDVTALPIETPSGTKALAAVTRQAGIARARFESTAEPGVYRLSLADSSRAGAAPAPAYAYAVVRPDPRANVPGRLGAAEAERLARGWPFHYQTGNDLSQMVDAMFNASSTGAPREFWRWLILAALAALAAELYLTRRLARGQGVS